MKKINNKIWFLIVISIFAISPQILLTAYAQGEGMKLCPGGIMLPVGVTCPTSAPTVITTPDSAQSSFKPSPTNNPTGGSTFVAPAPTKTSATGKSGGTQSITLPNPLGSGTKTLGDLVNKIVDWLILISSVAVLPFMIVWGAFQLLSAGGNEENVTKGRHTITWAVVGYGLLLISKGVQSIITEILNR